jgi:hypothetical protein
MELWVVWSFEHEAWWGPGRFGYVTELALAGRYSKAEALDIETKANRHRPTRHEQAMPLIDAEACGPPIGS